MHARPCLLAGRKIEKTSWHDKFFKMTWYPLTQFPPTASTVLDDPLIKNRGVIIVIVPWVFLHAKLIVAVTLTMIYR